MLYVCSPFQFRMWLAVSHKTWHEPYATEGHPTALLLRTAVLKSVLSTSRSHELVRWNVS